MITGLFLSMYGMFVSAVSFLIPNWTIPEYYLEGFREVMTYVWMFDGIIPIQLLFNVLSYIFFLELSIAVIRVVFKGINFARGVGSLEI